MTCIVIIVNGDQRNQLPGEHEVEVGSRLPIQVGPYERTAVVWQIIPHDVPGLLPTALASLE